MKYGRVVARQKNNNISREGTNIISVVTMSPQEYSLATQVYSLLPTASMQGSGGPLLLLGLFWLPRMMLSMLGMLYSSSSLLTLLMIYFNITWVWRTL